MSRNRPTPCRMNRPHRRPRARAAARQRGAVMIETVLALPFFLLILSLIIFFGFQMKRLQKAAVMDRYDAWQYAAWRADEQGAEPMSSKETNAQIVNTFFREDEPTLERDATIYFPMDATDAVVATAGNLYVEFLNYHLYRKVMGLERAEPLRESRVVRLLVRLFEKAPFLTVWLCSCSILPYWAVRIVAPVAGYPMERYLGATLLGRLPKIWLFAALGAWWSVSTALLLAVTAAGVAVGLGTWAWKRWRGEDEKAGLRPGRVGRAGGTG